MNKRFFLIICLAPLLLQCNKAPVFPVEPELEYLDIQPRLVNKDPSYIDTVVISFRFHDGDGDIGNTQQDSSYQLFVRDNRPQYANVPGNPYPYLVPDLTSNTRNPSIMGEMKINYIQPVLPLGKNIDKTTFTVYLYDRAGHKSNEITTDTITITK
jgi:hypothetical protein